MKKVGDLFAELGFRPDASDSVKRAFVENLVRAAGVSERVDSRAKQMAKVSDQPPSRNSSAPKSSAAKSTPAAATASVPSQQLSFNFEDLNSDVNAVSVETKRRSS